MNARSLLDSTGLLAPQLTDVDLAASSATHVSEAARRYAGAIFDLADSKGDLANIASELSVMQAMVADSTDLARLLDSPAFSRDQKVSALTDLAAKANFSKVTTGFLGTMAENGRANEILSAIAAFDSRYADHRGVKRAVAITATDMSADQRAKLEGVLAKAVGSDIELETEVDPALVGGIQLRIGSKLIDASIASKLDRMNTAMKGA